MSEDVKVYSIEEILENLTNSGLACEVAGPENEVTGVAPLNNCAAGDLVWSRSMSINTETLPASVIVLPLADGLSGPAHNGKTLIFVKDPREAFRVLLGSLFSNRVAAARGLDDSRLFLTPLRGSGVVVAEGVSLGENVVLHPNVVIYPSVSIGDNVEIGAGSVIGAPGNAYVRQPDGSLRHFPHIGGVTIGDNVTIGANTNVDSGGLGPTRIGSGTKVGNLCQIAHNVEIGSDCLLAGRVQIGGGTKIGNRTEIWPSSIISHKLIVGNGCDIKIGSVVVQNVPDDSAVSGNFAIPHHKSLREFAKRRK